MSSEKRWASLCVQQQFVFWKASYACFAYRGVRIDYISDRGLMTFEYASDKLQNLIISSMCTSVSLVFTLTLIYTKPNWSFKNSLLGKFCRHAVQFASLRTAQVKNGLLPLQFLQEHLHQLLENIQ